MGNFHLIWFIFCHEVIQQDKSAAISTPWSADSERSRSQSCCVQEFSFHSALNWPHVTKRHFLLHRWSRSQTSLFEIFWFFSLCISAPAIRDDVVIIYYHGRLKTQSPKTRALHTDLYFNCGVELTQSQQQQRPPAVHKTGHGHIFCFIPRTHTCAECRKQNAGNRLTSQSPARSRSLYPEGRKMNITTQATDATIGRLLEHWGPKLIPKQPLKCLNVPVLVVSLVATKVVKMFE